MDYLSTREAACSLSIPYHTLMRWIYSSKLRATKRGQCWYIHVTDVEAKREELSA